MGALNLKIANLTHAGGKTDIEKRDRAVRLLTLAVGTCDSEQTPFRDQSSLDKAASSPAMISSALATMTVHAQKLYDKYGQFNGMETFADNAEQALGRVPLSFLHDIAASDVFYPELDPAFVNYFVKKYDACFAEDPNKTSEITTIVLDRCSQDPDGLALVKPLIEAASAKLPALYIDNIDNDSAADRLATKIETYVHGIKTNDGDGIRNIYRIPALIHSAPLVETGNLRIIAPFFDHIFPEWDHVDETFRGELMPRLRHINMHASDIAAKLLARLSGQNLETHEVVTLRDTGSNLFSRTADRKPGTALLYWDSVLSLCDSAAAVAAAEATIAAAEPRFVHDAAFAQSYLTRLSTRLSADPNLLCSVRGTDLVTGLVDGHFVVVGGQNRTSVMNGGQQPISGPASTVLSEVIKLHSNELDQVLLFVAFVAQAQSMLAGRADRKGSAPYREVLMERVGELAHTHG